MSAIMELLKQVYETSKRLNIPCSDLVLDNAIYAKGLQILSHPANYHLQKSMNMRTGGFHTASIFIAVIGKRFEDGGLKRYLLVWLKYCSILLNLSDEDTGNYI